jgi:hypothetical protein
MLAHIEDLQAKVIEMREREGDVDLVLENELLKAQLEEHKGFVQGLIRMGGNVPAGNLVEKKKLYRQGADYAVSKVQALLASTVRSSGEWRRAHVSPELLSMFPEGADLALWYQIVSDFSSTSASSSAPNPPAQRLNIRCDQIVPNCTANHVAETYWALWTDLQVVRDFFRHTTHVNPTDVTTSVVFHDETGSILPRPVSITTKIESSTPSSTTATMALVVNNNNNATSTTTNGNREVKNVIEEEALATLHTRENIEGGPHVMNNVFVASKSRVAIAKGSLYLPMREDGSQSEQTLTTTSSSSQTTPPPRERCYLCARSSTRKDQMSELISSLYIEGSVCWDLPPRAIPGKRRMETSCRLASVISYPDVMQLSYFRSFADIVDEKGNVAAVFAHFAASFAKMMVARSKGETGGPEGVLMRSTVTLYICMTKFKSVSEGDTWGKSSGR